MADNKIKINETIESLGAWADKGGESEREREIVNRKKIGELKKCSTFFSSSSSCSWFLALNSSSFKEVASENLDEMMGN